MPGPAPPAGPVPAAACRTSAPPAGRPPAQNPVLVGPSLGGQPTWLHVQTEQPVLTPMHCNEIPGRYVNGRHYSRTLEDWLRLHDAAKGRIMPLFEQARNSYFGLQTLLASGF